MTGHYRNRERRALPGSTSSSNRESNSRLAQTYNPAWATSHIRSAAHLITLQRAAGNAAVQRLVRAATRSTGQIAALGGRVTQRAGHRPAQHSPAAPSRVRYQNYIWDVQVSAPGNPQITIWREPNHTVNLQWAQADYTIIRPNTPNDHDLRLNDPGAVPPVDEYPGIGNPRREQLVGVRFRAAKQRALAMIKNTVLPLVPLASRPALQALTLDDFVTSQTGTTLIGPSHTQPAEWQCNWVEGDAANPRRTWTFVIDSDNPLPDSVQEPHVGWTVSARAGSQAAVGNTFGHVWLDHVPVSRQ